MYVKYFVQKYKPSTMVVCCSVTLHNSMQRGVHCAYM